MTKDQKQTEQAVKVRHAFENIRNNYVGWEDNPNFKVLEDALTALSQVRGKAQEPVAWMLEFDDERIVTADPAEVEAWKTQHDNPYTPIPLYAAAPQVAQEEGARKFVGIGELERTGYIPAGSAAEREAKAVPQSDAQQSSEKDAEILRLREIARLIGSIFVHGGFKAETHNERELEKLLREQGTFWDSLADFDDAIAKEEAK